MAVVGGKVRVINNDYNRFALGEIVDVLEVNRTSVIATNGLDKQYLSEGDFEEVNETLELIANLSAEVVRLSKRVEALELRVLEQKADDIIGELRKLGANI